MRYAQSGDAGTGPHQILSVEQAPHDRPMVQVDVGVAVGAGPEADEPAAVEHDERAAVEPDVGTRRSAAGDVEAHRSPPTRSGHRTSSSPAAGVEADSSSILALKMSAPVVELMSR
jgi:hypothetical protein